MRLLVKFVNHSITTVSKLQPKQTTLLEMQCEDSYASLLQASASTKALAEGKQVHARILITGTNQNISFGAKLLNMYAMCGALVDARVIFDKLPKYSVFCWNAMIRGYVTHGYCELALTLFYQMLGVSIQPDKFTFPCVIKACANLAALQLGKDIQNHIVRSRFESDVFVVSALVDMYAKCGNVEDARQLFDKMSHRDVVSWNVMIAGYAKNQRCDDALKLFRQMRLSGVEPNSVTFASVLSACALRAALQHGQEIHNCIIRGGFESDVLVGNALIALYSKCMTIENAHHVFDRMSPRDDVTWNAMIAGYAQNGHCDEALKLFGQMKMAGLKPNSVTIASILPSCSSLAALQQGKEIHAYIIRSGIESDAFVGSALIDMYSKCGSVDMAQKFFNQMSEIDVVLWSAMIAGYAQNGLSYEALKLFQCLQLTGVKPNSVTIASILPACANLAALQQGKEIHSYIIRNGFESEFFVGSSLIDMYAKCGSVDIACIVFDKMPQRDVVSWNAMITGYSQNERCDEALQLFRRMGLAVVNPDTVTIAGVLSACARLAALQYGKEIHSYIVRNEFESDILVGSALIDMYAKCGSLIIARQVFEMMFKRNVVTWNTMIAGYGMHGYGEKAVTLFNQMQQAGVKPDHITFVAVMSACSHAGLVDEGCQYFYCMIQDHCIMPRVEHYACMVDLLGRAGRLNEAYNFMNRMPLEPDASVWGTLLGACQIHCNIELGEHVAEHLFELEPENAGYYVLLSNIYAAAGRWDNVAKVRLMMKDRGLRKTPGCSWIEVKNRVHTFLAGDKSHPQSEKLYAVLESLTQQMKKAGYVPNTNLLLHDLEED
eukprot:Gb_04417 [translate_table: standard]